MAKYRLPSSGEAETFQFLLGRLDEKQIRTLLRPENTELDKPERTRLISRRRLGNLASGRGRLTEAEAERLRFLRQNVQQVEALSKRGGKLGKRDYQVNRAIRSWVDHGKTKDAKYDPKSDQLRAIKALRYLGVDPEDGIFYVKGRE